MRYRIRSVQTYPNRKHGRGRQIGWNRVARNSIGVYNNPAKSHFRCRPQNCPKFGVQGRLPSKYRKTACPPNQRLAHSLDNCLRFTMAAQHEMVTKIAMLAPEVAVEGNVGEHFRQF